MKHENLFPLHTRSCPFFWKEKPDQQLIQTENNLTRNGASSSEISCLIYLVTLSLGCFTGITCGDLRGTECLQGKGMGWEALQ